MALTFLLNLHVLQLQQPAHYCYVLFGGSIMGGLLGACLGKKFRKLALWLFGAAAGSCFGYFLYFVCESATFRFRL